MCRCGYLKRIAKRFSFKELKALIICQRNQLARWLKIFSKMPERSAAVDNRLHKKRALVPQ